SFPRPGSDVSWEGLRRGDAVAGADAPDQTHLEAAEPDAVVGAALGSEQEAVRRNGVFHEPVPARAGESYGYVHRPGRPDAFQVQIHDGAVQVVVLTDVDLGA